MIYQLSGRLIEKSPTFVIIDCGGVGYQVWISLHTYSQLGNDENIQLFTEFIVREDTQKLYGFKDKVEKEVFNHLISVSGIGANTAILMLSALPPHEVAKAIQAEDVSTIKSIKGIGAKTAQRVIVDLKDKMSKIEGGEEILSTQDNTKQFEALTALISLGFDKKRIEKVLNKVDSDDLSVEEVIKTALKQL